MTGPPTFLGNLLCLCPALRPRQDQRTRPFSTSTRPPLCPQRRLLHRSFRGSITRPWHSLSTLRRVDHSTTTQDSLPAAGQLCRTGLATRRVPFQRFQSFNYISSSFAKLRGARTFYINALCRPRHLVCAWLPPRRTPAHSWAETWLPGDIRSPASIPQVSMATGVPETHRPPRRLPTHSRLLWQRCEVPLSHLSLLTSHFSLLTSHTSLPPRCGSASSGLSRQSGTKPIRPRSGGGMTRPRIAGTLASWPEPREHESRCPGRRSPGAGPSGSKFVQAAA